MLLGQDKEISTDKRSCEITGWVVAAIDYTARWLQWLYTVGIEDCCALQTRVMMRLSSTVREDIPASAPVSTATARLSALTSPMKPTAVSDHSSPSLSSVSTSRVDGPS